MYKNGAIKLIHYTPIYLVTTGQVPEFLDLGIRTYAYLLKNLLFGKSMKVYGISWWVSFIVFCFFLYIYFQRYIRYFQKEKISLISYIPI